MPTGLSFVAVAIVTCCPCQQLLVGVVISAEFGDERGSLLSAEFRDGAAASANEEDSGFGDLVVEWIVFKAHCLTPSSGAPCRFHLCVELL